MAIILENKVSLKITENYIKIYIDGITHIQIPYVKKIVMSNYRQGKNWYVIVIADKKGKILSETWYKEITLWIDILKAWDQNIN